MTIINMAWDDSKLRSGHRLTAIPFGERDADGLETGVAFIDRTSGFGGTPVVSDRSPLNDRKALDILLGVANANRDAFATLKNTFQRNDDFGARSGEVSLFIDNKGTKNDLRWRGDIAAAPQPILDLLIAARVLEIEAKRS